MSRGIRNTGYEMDEYAGPHQRSSENLLPGQTDDRYYHDQMFRPRPSRERDRRHDDTQWQRGIDDEPVYRSNIHRNNRYDRRSPERPRSSRDGYRNDQDHARDRREMRMERDSHSFKGERDYQQSVNYRPEKRNMNAGWGEREMMDDIEERLSKYDSSSHDRTQRHPHQFHQPHYEPKHEMNPYEVRRVKNPENRNYRYNESEFQERPRRENVHPHPINSRAVNDFDEVDYGPAGYENFSNNASPPSFRDPGDMDPTYQPVDAPYFTQAGNMQILDPETSSYTMNHDHDPYQQEQQRMSGTPDAVSNLDDVMNMLPSQMDRATGTLRFRGTMKWNEPLLPEDGNPDVASTYAREEVQPKTKAELVEQLTKLREQPWPMQLRKSRKNELKQELEAVGGEWYSIDTVVSAVEMGTSRINDAVNTLDPLNGMLRKIEGSHGASAAAVFNFIRDMIRLNLVLALLGLVGIVIPSAFSVSQETDQAFGWYAENGTSGVCEALQLIENSTLQECNQNYTDKIESDIETHAHQVIALIQDFLQGTGFLEWTILFSGYYPAAVESGSYLVSLAYLLSVLVIYIVSLVFVVHFVAKFLKNAASSYTSYGMTFSTIVFTGWDFTVKEIGAAKTESSLFVSEVKAAFDDDEYNERQLRRTRNDKIKLYLGRILINLVIFTAIGGSWAGIYFLVNNVPEPEVGSDPTDFVKNFIWEYAPTLTVAGLNLIFPIIFNFLVKYEYYRGHVELFLTLGRCILVRLTSLAMLIISKVLVIYGRDRDKDNVCNPNFEFICWETHLGQQVYAILVLDVIIQIGMTFVVNTLRSSLRRFNNGFCKMIGTIEFFVPSHVLDIVYIQAVCWVGLLYSPLLVSCCLAYFCLIFFIKLFTLYVTCIPATRVFRSSRSSAMFMTILALAFFMCLVPNAMSLLFLAPSLACSPFRGLDYAWEVLTYYICNLDGSAYWIRTLLFHLDGGIICMVLIVVVFLLGVYYASVITARGAMIKQLEKKLKTTNKDLSYLVEQYKQAQEISIKT